MINIYVLLSLSYALDIVWAMKIIIFLKILFIIFVFSVFMLIAGVAGRNAVCSLC